MGFADERDEVPLGSLRNFSSHGFLSRAKRAMSSNTSHWQMIAPFGEDDPTTSAVQALILRNSSYSQPPATCRFHSGERGSSRGLITAIPACFDEPLR